MLEEQEEAEAGKQKDSSNDFKPRRLYPGEKSPERPTRQIPTEVYMRRKELLDDVQAVLDIVEPGLSRRRGSINTNYIYIYIYIYIIIFHKVSKVIFSTSIVI